MLPKYPAEYLVGGDEVYDEAKGTFFDIQAALTARRQMMEGNGEEAIASMVNDIWDDTCPGKTEMNKDDCREFLTAFVKKTDHRLQVSNAAFNQIFGILDLDNNGSIDQGEMRNFISKFTTGALSAGDDE